MNRYIESINTYLLLKRYFGSMRLSRKGLPIKGLFKQPFSFFIDETSFYLTKFDELSKNIRYASTIETPQSKMALSKQVCST